MATMATTVHLLIVLHSLVAAAVAQPPVARPGCRGTCGDITVPYPFGIGAGCYRDDDIPGFQLECDDSGPSPPRLTVFGYRLAALSMEDGEITTYLSARRSCYNSMGGFVDGNGGSTTDMNLSGTAHLFSSTENQLVALGCPTLGYFVDEYGFYVSGCVSVCQQSSEHTFSCTGVGCCQSAIPSEVNFFYPQQSNNPNPNNSVAFTNDNTPCHYVFLVETQWFDSESVYLNDRNDDFEVPVVLDWAVRNVDNCSTASQMADFACRSVQSECLDVVNGPGYRCYCSAGYEGNPYLDNGCIDIDECQVEDTCYGDCANTPGNYTCQCPPEKSGDPTVKDGCKPKDKFTSTLRVVTGELMDDKVRSEMGPEALEEVTHLLMRCVSMNGEERPGMKEVAERLQGLRRYQRLPWGQASGRDSEQEEEENKRLLGTRRQGDVDYKFKPRDVLHIEGASAYTYSS